MMDEDARKTVRSRFESEHGEHYRIKNELGEGGSGIAYLADDLCRGIEVCAKLYLNGRAPSGARRDWRITSTLKHPLLADTFTVENFKGDDGEVWCAVISRFIPGRNLEDVVQQLEALRRTKELSDEHLQALEERLVRDVILDLSRALQFCHKNGYGHGDLSERNVIINDLHDGSEKMFAAIVIDFDNASYAPEQLLLKEGERVEKDVRSFRRLVGFITGECDWNDELCLLLEYCNTPDEIAACVRFVLDTTLGLWRRPAENYSEKHWSDRLDAFVAAMVGGRPFAREARNMILKVAETVGASKSLESAIERARVESRAPDIKVRVRSEFAVVREAARGLVGSPSSGGSASPPGAATTSNSD